MKANTGFLALGLFTIASVVTVSCGGSSDSNNTSNAAGTSDAAGTSNAAGSSSAGTANDTGGSNTTAGTGSGGRNDTAGNGNGGTFNFPGAGGAFDFPGAGGAGFTIPTCPTDAMDGAACTPMQGQFGCQVNDTTFCGCQGQQGAGQGAGGAGAEAGTTWRCVDTTNLPGAGGAGGNIPEATCPDNAMNGDDCSGGPGACTGQQCYCGRNNKVMCF